MEAVDSIVGRSNDDPVGRQDFAGIDFQHAHGLSVYFPVADAGHGKIANDLTTYRAACILQSTWTTRMPDSGWAELFSRFTWRVQSERLDVVRGRRHMCELPGAMPYRPENGLSAARKLLVS